jgi:hypothetical protein
MPTRASRAREELYGLPDAFSLIYGEWRATLEREVALPPGTDPAPPVTLFALGNSSEVLLRVSLIGLARFCEHDVVDSLKAMMVAGLPLAHGAGVRVPLEILEVVRMAVRPPELPEGREIIVVPRSPLSLRSGKASTFTSTSLIGGLARRLRGMAWWQGMRLDLPATTVDELIAGCEIVVGVGSLRPESYRRYSARQARYIDIVAQSGAFLLRGPAIGRLSPLLAMASCAHLGGRATHGYGAVLVGVYP